ncbi:chemotaxis response regulator protein-glutamate methylesterase [Tissierella sp.]|uniref:protein-glutamate methylesterase/protein-glutamine glutaminase n=1 Tax=Tissierella sp. TaxID=41274 RepID=UPI0028593F89|nr:chemotaxis response regulator protein-glutamate methylesterase [Tissierella sp.]MDR7856248.1 chemotaxis response regulator protein-glutamate methylesterase [Tissierella sp.]
MIRVLIVDDSALMRKILADILNSDDDISVIDTAKNGEEALRKIDSLKPDLVTMDIEMPLMDGITTLKHIVTKFKIPVIMISSLTSQGAELTLKALDEGAVDFLAKPTNIFSLSQSDIKMEIIDKVKAGSKSKLCNREPINRIDKLDTPIIEHGQIQKNFTNIIAIGTSTGGPRALQSLLPELPSNINASIVVVQHMPPKFTKSLADRLNLTSSIKIKEAEEGDVLCRGHAYIAPGDFHMEIVKEGKDLVVRLNKKPQVMGLRPTVDALMESVSKISNFSKIGIILTGMGSDGTKGIVQMKESNSYTIAQDEASSVVFGMPKAAISTRLIDEILPLNEIAGIIMKKVGV